MLKIKNKKCQGIPHGHVDGRINPPYKFLQFVELEFKLSTATMVLIVNRKQRKKKKRIKNIYI
jgi:hypothetical protein